MPHYKSKTDNRDRSQVSDVEETEIDYVVRKAGVPREQARQVIKGLRKKSPSALEPRISDLSARRPQEDEDLKTKIRTRAYQIWEDAGRPHGRDLEHWFAAESEVGARPAASMSRQNAPRETLPTIGSTARDQNELPRNNRYEEPEAAETNHNPEFGPSSSARKLQRSVKTPPGLPLSRPLSDN